MYCPRCGKESENLKFCSECGTELKKSVTNSRSLKKTNYRSIKKIVIVMCLLIIVSIIMIIIIKPFENGDESKIPVQKLYTSILEEDVDLFLALLSPEVRERFKDDYESLYIEDKDFEKLFQEKFISFMKEELNALGIKNSSDIVMKSKRMSKNEAIINITIDEVSEEIPVFNNDGIWYLDEQYVRDKVVMNNPKVAVEKMLQGILKEDTYYFLSAHSQAAIDACKENYEHIKARNDNSGEFEDALRKDYLPAWKGNYNKLG
ncbi:MAG: zinc ribbon domain-containing protein, partial [Halanaerobiales bacterium]